MKFFINIWKFYFEGFRNMSTWGRQVWIIILIKLFVLFFVLKLFFFPDFFKTRFNNDQDRSEYMLEVLTDQIE